MVMKSKLLGQNHLQESLKNKIKGEFELLMRASETSNGFSSSTFHQICDGKGPTLTIFKANDLVFGGFTNISWSSNGSWQHDDKKAFIFKAQNLHDSDISSMEILDIKEECQNVVFHSESYGPSYGWVGIEILDG